MMYKIMLVCFLVFYFSESSFSQNNEVKKTPLAKGVYLNSNEFFHNAPSVTKEFKVKTEIKIEKSDSVITDYAFVFADSSLLDDYWGFCDGNDVFVNTSYGSFSKRNLKLEQVGKFSFTSINRKRISVLAIVGTPAVVISTAAITAVGSATLPAKEQILIVNEHGKLRQVSINFLQKECKKNPELIRGIGWNGDPSNDEIRKILIKLNQINQ